MDSSNIKDISAVVHLRPHAIHTPAIDVPYHLLLRFLTPLTSLRLAHSAWISNISSVPRVGSLIWKQRFPMPEFQSFEVIGISPMACASYERRSAQKVLDATVVRISILHIATKEVSFLGSSIKNDTLFRGNTPTSGSSLGQYLA